jgi:Na+-driven multidrug efflux pump
VKSAAAAPEGDKAAAAPFRGLLRDLRDAVRGTEMDYTQGSLGRAILLLSVPMMLEMAMESVFAVVDVYFVSSLGPSAIATVGLTESVLTLLYAVAIGLSMGTTALVARCIGEKHRREAADTAVQAIAIALAASIPFALVGVFFAKDVLALMGADAWAVEHGYRYTAWMLGGNAVIMLIWVMNAVFRGAGDAGSPCGFCGWPTPSTSCSIPSSFSGGARCRRWGFRAPPWPPTSAAGWAS